MAESRRINEYGEIVRDAPAEQPVPLYDRTRVPDVSRLDFRQPTSRSAFGAVLGVVVLTAVVVPGGIALMSRRTAPPQMAPVPMMLPQGNPPPQVFVPPQPNFPQGVAAGQDNVPFDPTKRPNVEQAEQAERDFALAEDLRFGRGVEPNMPEAFRLYKKVAEQGHPTGQHVTAWMYENGVGVQRDYVEAMKWYRKSAEQGYSYAQHGVGYLLHNGLGVQPDYAEAMKWYRKAAEQGLASSQTSIGVLYHNGQGVPQNYGEALHWYRKATDQNHPDAQYNTALLYESGLGVKKDVQTAIGWYRRSAAQGQKDAIAALTRLNAK